jgi:hypothetical protein
MQILLAILLFGHLKWFMLFFFRLLIIEDILYYCLIDLVYIYIVSEIVKMISF